MAHGSKNNQSLKRVKVYFLSDVWIDNGTGYCSGEILDGKDPYLIVKNELDESEELLRSKIEGPIQFQRQQDTLIVWTDTNGQNIALSFQEKDGCNSLCDFIIRIYKGNLAPQISLCSVIASTEMDGEITELITGPVNFPPLDPVNSDLPLILSIFTENLSSPYQKSSVSNFITEYNYIHDLVKIFEESEEKKKIKSLHLLCNILKTLILYNEGSIIESMLEDENILGVVGILEYDPDFPQFKANHREFLRDKTNFREILPLKDSNIKDLIKKTFKLQFLKDVVLVRLLDDPTFNLISTLIHFNQVEVIEFLEKGNYIEKLFELYQKPHDGDEEVLTKQRDGIRLMHQFIMISKNLPPHQKTSFYQSLIEKGLLRIIDFVLKDGLVEIRVLGTEIIVSIIEHDVLLINGLTEEKDEEDGDDDQEDKGESKAIEKSEKDNGSKNGVSHGSFDDLDDTFNGDDYEKDEDSLLDHFSTGDDGLSEENLPHKNLILSDDMTLLMILTQFLLDDNDPGLRIQAFEALKSLLDPISSINNPMTLNDETFIPKLKTDDYFNSFYEKVAPKLFGPLIDLKEREGESSNRKDDLFIHLCELINFCSKDKTSSRSFFLENHILTGISRLIEPSHKLQLRLAAIRCIKSIIKLNDDYYTRYIISNDSLNEVFKFLDEIEGSGDLIFSTILDLVEMILVGLGKQKVRKNYKLLASYIVSNFKESLSSITAVHSGEDLIKFIEQEYSHMSINQSSEFEDTPFETNDENDDPSTLTGDDILTEPIQEDELLTEEALKENNDRTKQHQEHIKKLKAEKRLREDEVQEKSNGVVKKRTFKQKFQNASKKLASKFSTK